MESSSNNVNKEVSHGAEEQPQVEVVLWDFDGPLNKIEKLRVMVERLFKEHPDDWQQAARELEQKHKGLRIFAKEGSDKSEVMNLSVYIQNPELIKATLSILDQNHVTSIIASQRTTYGFGLRLVISMLEAIETGKPHPFEVKSEKEIKHFTKMLDKSFKGIPRSDFFEGLLLDFAMGKIKPEDAHDKLQMLIQETRPAIEDINETERRYHKASAKVYDNLYQFVIGNLKRQERDETYISQFMYHGINHALGEERPFLLQRDAEIIGETVALYGIDTGSDKYSYTLAFKNVPALKHLHFDPENKGKNALLVDDRDYKKNFPHGMFVLAPVTSAEEPDDLSYLAKVLLKSVPLPKLLKDLLQYEDKQSAEQLLGLVIAEKLKDVKIRRENMIADIMNQVPFQTLLSSIATLDNKQQREELLMAIFKEKLITQNFATLLSSIIENGELMVAIAPALLKTMSKNSVDILHEYNPQISQLINYAMLSDPKTPKIPFIEATMHQLAENSVHRNYMRDMVPYALELYALELSANEKLSDIEKKAKFKGFVLHIIAGLNNYANIEDGIIITKIIERLQSPQFNDLLRLETGGHKTFDDVFSGITKKEAKKYGMTTTWSDIIVAAKKQVEANIDRALSTETGRIKVSETEDAAFRKLLGMPSGRFASQMGKLLSHINLEGKTPELKNYEQLRYNPEKGWLMAKPTKPTQKKQFY